MASKTEAYQSQPGSTGRIGLCPTSSRHKAAVEGSWSGRLDDLVLTRAFTANNQPMTIAIGLPNDQIAQSDIMDALYNEHLPVSSVELCDESQH